MTGVLIREKRQRFKTQKLREGSHGRLEQIEVIQPKPRNA